MLGEPEGVVNSVSHDAVPFESVDVVIDFCSTYFCLWLAIWKWKQL